jgi:transmembrane sensor
MADSRDSGALAQRLARIAPLIDARLTDGDVERLIEGARQRGRRRAVTRGVLGAVALGAAAVAVVAGVGRRSAPEPAVVAQSGAPGPAATNQPAAGTAPALLRLADGSVVTPLDSQSQLRVIEDTPERVSIALERGGARFDVVPRPHRAFSVMAGDVAVMVVGTVFKVERVAERVGVTVERGAVRVDWKPGRDTLYAGESKWFPPPAAGAGGSDDDEQRTQPPTRRDRQRPPRRELETVRPATDGVDAEAERAPRPDAGHEETADDLLSAADAARLAGRPEEGAMLLRRLLKQHANDPRAPLAAFTLGRVLLMELGRPREAAAVFADVRARAPEGPFAEDALAREVEAWVKAGEPDQARARAQEYLRLYPHGGRAQAVKALGGLE